MRENSEVVIIYPDPISTVSTSPTFNCDPTGVKPPGMPRQRRTERARGHLRRVGQAALWIKIEN